MSEDIFEEVYDEIAFGNYKLLDVYETFNAAMNIGTPNVFRVYEEDGLAKIIIAKEANMELPPFKLRPISGPCVATYQKLRRKQRSNYESDSDNSDNNEDEKPKIFKNTMPLAQPMHISKYNENRSAYDNDTKPKQSPKDSTWDGNKYNINYNEDRTDEDNASSSLNDPEPYDEEQMGVRNSGSSLNGSEEYDDAEEESQSDDEKEAPKQRAYDNVDADESDEDSEPEQKQTNARTYDSDSSDSDEPRRPQRVNWKMRAKTEKNVPLNEDAYQRNDEEDSSESEADIERKYDTGSDGHSEPHSSDDSDEERAPQRMNWKMREKAK
eukprot:253294_1